MYLVNSQDLSKLLIKDTLAQTSNKVLNLAENRIDAQV